MPKPLKILHLCSEISPLAKTGGLADVCAALPRALHRLGHEVRIAMPCYGSIPWELRGEPIGTCVARLGQFPVFGGVRQASLPGQDIPLYLIEHDGFFMRDRLYGENAHSYPDNLARFSFFSLAALDAIPQTGWEPDVIHCHDWHTALVPIFVRTRHTLHPTLKNIPTVLTIHNLAYQGRFPADQYPQTGLHWELFNSTYLECHGDTNLLKGGILFATKINTVSPRYAKEIQEPDSGHGLDATLRDRAEDLSGILNGADYDVYSPVNDAHLDAPYSAENIEGKSLCKAALQQELNLPQRDVPLFGMVSRLVWDKGIDYLIPSLARALAEDIQVVIIGSGDPDFESGIAGLVWPNSDKVRVIFGYDERLAHRVFAGADFYLMPSRREPCGLSQLYALAYGAIPIVHNTGGLINTVQNVTPATVRLGRATGIVFDTPTQEGLVEAMCRAIALHDIPEQFAAVRTAAMKKRFDWERSANEYLRLYRKAMKA